MPTLTAAQTTLLAQRNVMRRIFLEVDAVDPDTGLADPGYFWDDVFPLTIGAKTYQGIGHLGEVISVEGKSDLSITPVVLSLSGISAEVASLIRGRVKGQEPMRLYFGIFNPDTKAISDALILMFQGYIDDVQITTPKTGELSTISITCESVARELTIRSFDTRSHESQRKRKSTDQFFIFTGNIREREIPFGMKNKKGDKKKKSER